MKSARHEKIIELIQEYDIDTQEELAARLNEAGFKVTQATVSRDIRALKLMKVAGKDGKSRYAILTEPSAELGDKYTRILQDTLTSLDVGQNMLVIRTVPGMAMGVAAEETYSVKNTDIKGETQVTVETPTLENAQNATQQAVYTPIDIRL